MQGPVRVLGIGHSFVGARSGATLDCWFPVIRVDPAEAPDSGPLTAAEARALLGPGEVLAERRAAMTETGLVEGRLIAVLIDDLDTAPVDAADAYLRLHLLSSRLVRPHGCNLDGLFGLLTNVAWTTAGPVEPAELDQARVRIPVEASPLGVNSVDKFPRMTDYVVPSGVRIADADRVRLGAHLAEGTTVMHEGFVNFNAGTLGSSMIEGRISAGVVVGDHSDVGGGASIMGTLSGGGTEVISIGEKCLLGANAGLGIGLGDGCTVEAGLYLTAGTKVTLPDGEVVKALTLSGRSNLLFIRNSTTGAVEARPNDGSSWQGLNIDLHSNQ